MVKEVIVIVRASHLKNLVTQLTLLSYHYLFQ